MLPDLYHSRLKSVQKCKNAEYYALGLFWSENTNEDKLQQPSNVLFRKKQRLTPMLLKSNPLKMFFLLLMSVW